MADLGFVLLTVVLFGLLAGLPPFVSASPSGRRIEVRVVDHGPGIPADRHEQVFHPLQRLGHGGDDSGAGLGLALSRGLTEAMGARSVPRSVRAGA